MDINVTYNYRDLFFMAHKTIDTLSNLLEAMRIHPTNHTIHVARLPESIEASNVNYKLVGAAHYTVGGGHLTIRKDRPDYQLIITVNGRANAVYKGREYTLNPGSILLVDCKKLHKYYVDENDFWEYKHLHFTAEYPGILLNDAPDYVENCPILSHYFNELSAFSCSPDVNNKIAPYIYSNLIDNMLTSLIKENYNCSLDKSRLRFSEIVKYIHDHYNEPISLSDLSKQFNYSESYFIRAFKKYYNYTPHQYLIKYRIDRVYERLLNGETVQSAALACGFNSASSFYYSVSKIDKA